MGIFFSYFFFFWKLFYEDQTLTTRSSTTPAIFFGRRRIGSTSHTSSFLSIYRLVVLLLVVVSPTKAGLCITNHHHPRVASVASVGSSSARSCAHRHTHIYERKRSRLCANIISSLPTISCSIICAHTSPSGIDLFARALIALNSQRTFSFSSFSPSKRTHR